MNNMKIVFGLAVSLAFVGAAFAGRESEGGELIKRGTYLGHIAVVNQQTRIPAADINAAMKVFADSTKCNVNGDEKGAQIVLKVVDDEKEPVMLIAPEDHWGKVNVAKLVSDLPGENAKKKFIVPRARKMILRALSLLCGGGSSSFRGNLVSVTTLREMDSAQEQIAIDMVNRYIPYLEKLGVTRKEMTTYADACEQGWAPAPTNSVQKQIWDEIHALPTAPLKIKPETKKVEK